MNASEYLKQIEMLDILLKNKRQERKRWEQLADSIGTFSTAEKVKSTHDPHRSSNAIINYCDIDREISELERKRKSIIKTIERLPPSEYKVIYNIFVEYCSLKEVASLCDKSYDWVKKKKRVALVHIQGIIDAE